MTNRNHLQLALERPNEIAIEDETRTRSWSELVERSTRLARFLREDAALEPDDHVALLMGNRVEVVELVLGAIMAGIWITPINGHLAEREIEHVIHDSGTRILFTDSQYESIAHRVLGDKRTILVGEQFDTCLASASLEPMDPTGPAGGNMIYTSGTTGLPKGVKRARPKSVGAALDHLSRTGTRSGLDGSGPHLITGPMYHAAPLMFAIYDNAGGAPLTIMERFDAERALELITEKKIAHLHMVPTMFVRLLQLPDAVRARFDASPLQLVLHGAAPISIPVKQRMIEWWGEVLVEYWGATEGGVNTLIDSADWLAHPGSVGRCLPNFEVFAVDDAGKRLPAGETGDLYCRHRRIEQVFEYHGDEEKTASAFLEPGVFTIGDIGFVNEDGYVFLADRKSSMIISGGVNIYPAEIEQILQEHPAIADVGVFGIPDDEWGESVKAAVELRPGHEASDILAGEILAFARDRLARYKVPRSIDFEIELPRHESGKLYTRRLRDPYWRDRNRKI